VVDAPDFSVFTNQKVVGFSVGTIGDQIETGYYPQLVRAPFFHSVVILFWVVIYELLNRADPIWTISDDGERD
tara:strand:- start:2 stop:220 length:219 start_codon:yes stop_codon:yes gene_type:complete